MAAPPVLDGGDHDTFADWLPGAATTLVGAPGLSGVGVTVAPAENGPWPTAFTAATKIVYCVPFVRGETVVDVAGAATVTAPQGGVAVHTPMRYDVIGAAPPPSAGGVHETAALPLCGTACTLVGASGT
jgi:hypothetical protein